MNIVEIAESVGAEYHPIECDDAPVVFSKVSELQTFADLIRVEDAKKIAELEKHNYELQFQNNLFVEKIAELEADIVNKQQWIDDSDDLIHELSLKLDNSY